ncbi:MAG: TPM domain-containing protein [Betaproteobacteria bacterium]
MLSTSDIAAIEARIGAIEAHTGAQVVVALVARSDHFHGLRWRAFALGAAAAAFVVVLLDLARPDWVTSHTAIVTAASIIGAGLACTLLATFVPAFERLFLPWTRAQAEVRRRATLLFLERELFATPRRNAVLLLAGRFERAMAVIGDGAYRDRIDTADWQRVVDATTPRLAAGDASAAFLAGLDALESVLVAQGFVGVGDARNDLPDTPLESDT